MLIAHPDWDAYQNKSYMYYQILLSCKRLVATTAANCFTVNRVLLKN